MFLLNLFATDLLRNNTNIVYAKELRDRNLIKATHEGDREYEISFENSELTRVILEQMDLTGLLPIRVDH